MTMQCGRAEFCSPTVSQSPSLISAPFPIIGAAFSRSIEVTANDCLRAGGMHAGVACDIVSDELLPDHDGGSDNR